MNGVIRKAMRSPIAFHGLTPPVSDWTWSGKLLNRDTPSPARSQGLSSYAS
jgi:hypothetical protein